MKRDVGVALGAVVVALLLLVPTVETLAAGVAGLSTDLAQGSFRPFAQPLKRGGLGGAGTAFGGESGSSSGGYLPGASAVPDTWTLDRDGGAAKVTIDFVFQPDPGAMKRFKAYDRVTANEELTVASAIPDRPADPRAGDLDNRLFVGAFDVVLHHDGWTPIYSPAPTAVVERYHSDPAVAGGLTFAKDSADTFYVHGDYDGRIRLNLTFAAPQAYFGLPAFAGAGLADYPASVRPPISADLKSKAQLVLARAGVDPQEDVALVVRSLATYFQGFGEGNIPGADQYPDLYLALALGDNGCCRHRAFAFAVTSESLGIPTRVVVNEAHAFVEVMFPRGDWHQINLGGCGTYDVNNPNGYAALFPQAATPKAPTPLAPAASLPVRVNLSSVPDPIEKTTRGPPATVSGTVTTIRSPTQADTVPLPDADVDLYLVPLAKNASSNATNVNPTQLDIARGTLVGTARTDNAGRFVVTLAPPRDLATGAYVLAAHSLPRRVGATQYLEAFTEWSYVRVTSATDLNVSFSEAGVGARSLIVVTLVDGLLAPVSRGAVTLTLDGAPSATALTDATGSAQFTPTFVSAGTHTVRVAYPGTAYLQASAASTTTDVSHVAFDIEPRLEAVRGETLLFAGRILRDGAPVANAEVLASLPIPGAASRVASNATGGFRVALVVPANVSAGAATLTLASPPLAATRHLPVTVEFRPTIRFGAPSTLYRGETLTLTGNVADDFGRPLPNLPIALRMTDPSGAQVWRSGTSDTAGGFALAVAAVALAPGRTAALLLVNASTATASASAERAFAIDVSAASAPLHVSLAAGAVALALAFGALAAAVLAWRRWRSRLAPRIALLARRLSLRATVGLRVELPGFPPELARAFAPGESVAVVVTGERRFRDGTHAPLAASDVTLAVGPRTVATVTLNARGVGTAIVPLAGVPEGATALVARFRGSARAHPAETRLPLRVTSYRKELERTYRALVGRLALPASTTPREVERA
ncbi:MAG: hypothetical protein ACYDCK_08520, partial [Thermoplasmatota archaeon]